ncbi:hypothetical protein [Nocardia kruczakiae]|uniref:hypothetical protein n=1 Tax=Nocardia kruczakiae TaxID=261477 RepID=UPI0012ED12F6|nr:hypothetical protein [Nocardia kruczakiae]
MQAALQKNPGMFQIIGDPPFCAGSLEALSTLKASQPELVPGQTKIRSMADRSIIECPNASQAWAITKCEPEPALDRH